MRVSALLAVWVLSFSGRLSGQVMDEHIYSLVQFDQLEYRQTGDANPITWDMRGWIGGDLNRFWIKSDGERSTTENTGELEVQALYSRLVTPFWEFQFGLRVDGIFGAGNQEARTLAVLGFEGLAPYWFELEPAVFVSHMGDVSARLTASYDVFVTQRLIAQPRLEMNGAIQDVPEFGVGSGLSNLELGFRLRFELRRKTAPYLGVSWLREFGDTAVFSRALSGESGALAAVGGVRLWF